MNNTISQAEVGTMKNPIHYENEGKTPVERRRIFRANVAKFEADAKAGKVLCLSDIIGQAEQVHIDSVDAEVGLRILRKMVI